MQYAVSLDLQPLIRHLLKWGGGGEGLVSITLSTIVLLLLPAIVIQRGEEGDTVTIKQNSDVIKFVWVNY